MTKISLSLKKQITMYAFLHKRFLLINIIK